MFSSSECVYASTHQARSIIPQRASNERHRWLTGTASLHAENELSVIEFDEDQNALHLMKNYSHPDQIWCMESSANDPSLVVTSHQSKFGGHGVTLFRMPGQSASDLEEDSGGNEPSVASVKEDLEEVVRVKEKTSSKSCVNSIRWHHQNDSLLTAGNEITVHQIAESEVVDTFELNTGAANDSDNDTVFKSAADSYAVATWDPHSNDMCAAARGKNLHFFDTRTCAITCTVQAHSNSIRDVGKSKSKIEGFASLYCCHLM